MKTKQFILVLLALFASVTAKAFRIDVGDDEDHLWLTFTVLNEDQKTAEVTSTDYAWGTCTIPAAANGYTIVSIGDNAFKNQTDLVEVVIPNTVTSIGASAFEGCTALGTLDHPVVVPASVTSVGVDAFKGTWWLDNTLPNGVIYINNTLYIYKGEIPANTAIDIADGTTTILSGAFKDCTGLTSVTIPATVTAIGSQAFDGCSSLTSVTVNNPTPVGISSNTFSNAANTTLWVPNFEAYNAYRAANNWKDFKRVTGIITFKEPKAETYCVGLWDTDNDGYLEFDEAAAVTELNNHFNSASSYSYSNWSSFDEFEYFTGVKTITRSFKKLRTASLKIPVNVTKIGDTSFSNGSFDGCTIKKLEFLEGDETLTIGKASTNYGDPMFGTKSGCIIDTLIIGRNIAVTNTDTKPFAGTYNLVVITDNVSSLSQNFTTSKKLITGNGTVDLSISCPIDSAYIGRPGTYYTKHGFITNNVSSIMLRNYSKTDNTNPLLTVDYLVAVDEISSNAFQGCSNLSSIVFHEGTETIQSIGDYAFSGCSSLTSLPVFPSLKTIGDYAFQNSGLTSIVFNEGLQSIGSYSFSNSDGLTTLSFPASLQTLGNSAFAECRSLSSISFSEGLKSIGNSAFFKCYNLASIHFPASLESIGDMAFDYCYDLCSLSFPANLKTIGNNAFGGCSSLVLTGSLPDGLQTIGSNAFNRSSVSGYSKTCKIDITIPATITSIGDNPFPANSIVRFLATTPITAFQSSYTDHVFFVPADAVDDYKTCWPDLANMIVSNSYNVLKTYNITANSSSSALVEAIGEENTRNIVRMKVSGTINSYDMMIMRNKLVNLRELDLSEVTIVSNSYNYGTGVSQDNVFPDFLKTTNVASVILPNTITSIGKDAFNGYKYMDHITIPASVTAIGENAFKFSNFKTIEVADNSQLQSIGNYAFYAIGYAELSNFPFANCSCRDYSFYRSYTVNPGSIQSAGEYAFFECPAITSINVAGSVSDYAFSGCSNLVSAKTGYVGTYAFQNCTNLESVEIDGGGLGDYAFTGCSKLKTVSVTTTYQWGGKHIFDGCPVETLIFGCDPWLRYQEDTNFKDNIAKTLTTVIIKEGVTSFGSHNNGVLMNCTKLTSVTLPKSLLTIGNQAFRNCDLSSVSLPENLTSIGDNAFFYAVKDEGELVLPRGVTEINEGCFYGCKYTSLKLSPNTTKIGKNAFNGCSISEIRLPSPLKSIGDGAFSGCSNLKTVYAYMPDIITIGVNTFPNYKTSTLYVPSFLYNAYYYDTNWSQFLQVLRCDLQPGDYETFYTNGDILFAEGEERITTDTPIATIGSQGSITVEGEAQAFDTVDQTVDANYSASLIGDGEGVANNMPMNELRVNIAVTAGKWYFFCFPFDVTIASCTYPGRYAWRSYDGATRAANGSGGWKKVTAEKLNAREGYAFQSETTGTLTVCFSAPTFGGNRTCELEVHSASNAQNASWNFVGNPYSSYYDFGTADITSPITVWTGSSYTAYRPGDDELHLRPYQAFFVQKPEAASSIQFNAGRRESYRQSQHTAASRALAPRTENVKSDRIFLDIAISDNDTATLDRTRLVLNEKAQRSYELDCDAAKFMADDAAAQIYMMEEGQPMAINERPVKGDIRLGYKAKNKGILSIKAQRMDLPMLLVDLVTGTEYDLSNGVYEFSTEAGTFNKRFMLRLSGEATAIRNLANETGVTISKTKGGLNVAGAEGKTVEVYNVGGSLVSCQNNGFISLPTGIYLVKVNDKNTKISVK